jgi:flagellar export protein FliJ
MKQFKFSLQTVHNFRETRRDSAEREFGYANAQLHGVKGKLAEVQNAHRVALDNYLLLYQSRELEVAVVGAHTDYIAFLVRREREVRGHIVTGEREVETKRLALTEALRDTKATANLRERQHQRHELDAARREQTLLDEMAVASIARRGAQR